MINLQNSLNSNSYFADVGILYVATGKKYLSEAFKSASITRQVSSLPIALCSDLPVNIDDSSFDFFIKHTCPRYCYRDKIPPLITPPL